MDALPKELELQILSHLSRPDLLALRLTNRYYANIVKPYVFGTILHLTGTRKQDWDWWFDKHSEIPNPLGLSKRVEYAKLDEAVEEVLSLAPFVKILEFSPAFYRDGFWDDYRRHLEQEAEEPIDHNEWDHDDDAFEEDPEGRVWETRQQRAEREAPLIEAAEEVWEEAIAAQHANADKIKQSMSLLIGKLDALQKIEVNSWKFGKFMGLEVESEDIDEQWWDPSEERRSDNSFTWKMFETLAEGLYYAGRQVEDLNIHNLILSHVNDSTATKHAFQCLTRLTLSFDKIELFLEAAPSARLGKLLEAAQQTLQHLTLNFGERHPWLPQRGVHTLDNILNNDPLVFPHLISFSLTSLILSGTSLINFLEVQPSLTSVSFSCIFLATPRVKWQTVANALPPAVRTFKISNLGHEPHAGFEPPVAYNWIGQWYPYEDPINGWRLPDRTDEGVRIRGVTLQRAD
ncbi:hypothetical protein H2199_006200 [Coniosporium tulheliwenetii]|uniref:Uncharacterized protein n=1 Tax=Coniosporium tulheliwenetii TaxID=3383036 RepID=A0ACC2YXF6_9PEZI|nr:hypothetical protein H2199_006200 [Cladosporium sp. JES 115]